MTCCGRAFANMLYRAEIVKDDDINMVNIEGLRFLQ